MGMASIDSYLFYDNCQNGVPISIAISRWERHLAAIPIDAGRLSHSFMLLLPIGTHF
jgi:hypothetical protein